MKVGGFFSGVGGIELGFQKAGFEIVWSNEIDKNATLTLQSNFSHKIYNCDIAKIKGNELKNVDVVIAGFPCQAFSIAGYRKGFDDIRGDVFFHIIRIIKELKHKPKILFLENVKNLYNHDKGNTFNVITKAIADLGYYVKHKVLNSKEYGNTPQNRERIYLVCFLNKQDYENFEFPEKTPLTKKINSILEKKVSENFYYTSEKYPKYYNMLKENMLNEDSIYQLRRIYVRENKSGVCPTLTANMGMGGHNVPLIKQNDKIRKLTPRECFNFQGYGDDYILPKNLANGHLYKQAGNSVSVNVIKRIAKNIRIVLNK